MAPDHDDHYRTLQVDPAAELDVIHAAYRVLARKAHPDLAGDAEVMMRLNVAWDVLRDSDRRAAYDRDRASIAAESSNGTKPAGATTAAASNGSNGANGASGTNGASGSNGAPGAAHPHRPAESVIFSAAPKQADHAGPPPGDPFGPIMTYGRYEGWSLGEIARVDPGFLKWLASVPSGRSMKRDIDRVLEEIEHRPFHLGSRRRTYSR